MNRNWTGKLQETLLYSYTSRKKLCSNTFKASSEEAILMHSEKIRLKYMKRMCERLLFVKLQVDILQVHYRLTSPQFSGILSKWTPSNGYFSNLYKMLKKHLWNSFLLYLVVEILQNVHEMAVSRRCSIKEVFR